MGSVSSSNPGLAYLMQALSNVNSPVATTPSLVSALQKASPSDIVQLSISATELEGVDALFGVSNGASNGFGVSNGSPDNSGSNISSLLASLESALTTPAGAASGTGTPATSSPTSLATSLPLSPAEHLSNYQSAFQSTELDALLGTGATTGSGSSFNIFG
jgi:hypothetical protein